MTWNTNCNNNTTITPGIPKKPTISEVIQLIVTPSPKKLSTLRITYPINALIKNPTIALVDLKINLTISKTTTNAMIKPKTESIINPSVYRNFTFFTYFSHYTMKHVKKQQLTLKKTVLLHAFSVYLNKKPLKPRHKMGTAFFVFLHALYLPHIPQQFAHKICLLLQPSKSLHKQYFLL